MSQLFHQANVLNRTGANHTWGHVDGALASGDRQTMLDAAIVLEEYNLGGCPMMAP